MAPALVLAVAADGEVRVPGQRREQVERAARVRRLHLGTVAPGESPPAILARVRLEQGDGLLARRQVREPHVVPVVRRDARLRDPAGRTPHRADARPLAGLPGGAETNDPDRHRALLASLRFSPASRLRALRRRPARRRRRPPPRSPPSTPPRPPAARPRG